jgi:hypothetical protein
MGDNNYRDLPAIERAKFEQRDREMDQRHSRAIAYFVVPTIAAVALAFLFGFPAYNRYQARQDAANQIAVNHLVIQQEEQNVDVEKAKAEIRRQEAIGIAEAQNTINATLTPLYIQHEAIQAQEKMVNSPNHTEIYIPSGANGVPIIPMVQNLNSGERQDTRPEQK